MKKIAISGGHLTPALALIEKLEEKGGFEIVYFGRRYATIGINNLSAEFQIISEKNIKFVNLDAGKIQRKFTVHTIPQMLKIPQGFISAFLKLQKEKPQLVVSFGGYLSTPLVFSAWLLKIKSITHEQSARPGLANRINSLFCQKVLVSWPNTKSYFPLSKTEVIGNLVRSQKQKKGSAKIVNFVKNSKNLLFVTGGNQGSHFLNNLIFSSLKSLAKYDVLHQVGTANFKNDHQKAASIKTKNYLYADYLKEADFWVALESSRIVISRSGANTVWELGLLAKPSVLIPLPVSSSGEQLENARILEDQKMAIILSQNEANTKTLEQSISKVDENYQSLLQNARKFSSHLPRDASQKLLETVLAYT